MRRVPSDAAIVADAKAGTADLVAAVKKAGYSKTSGRRTELREATAATQQDIQKVQPQMAYLNILREVLPQDGFVVEEMSQVGFASRFGFPVYEPRTFVTGGYQDNVGFGFMTALGVKIANPDKPVVVDHRRRRIHVRRAGTVDRGQVQHQPGHLVFNNNELRQRLRDQRNVYKGREIGSDLTNPDFVKLAGSFGAGAARVTAPDQFKAALEKALADGGPYVISVEVPTDSEVSPWAFIHPAKNI